MTKDWIEDTELDDLLEEEENLIRARERADALREERSRDGECIDTAGDYRNYILTNIC